MSGERTIALVLAAIFMAMKAIITGVIAAGGWVLGRMDTKSSPVIQKYADQISVDKDISRMTVDWEDMVFLDTETTGIKEGDRIVEIAIVNHDGRILLDTLVDPRRPIPQEATDIHGITDEMVRGQTTLEELTPVILELVRDKVVAIYNAEFDLYFLPELETSIGTACIMKLYSGGGRWVKLSKALKDIDGTWKGTPHRALTDALAARDIGFSLSGETPC